MPHTPYHNLLEMIGRDAGGLQGLFGEFEGDKERWARLLEPEFKRT